MLIAVIVIVGLSLLILGHEAGHFFVAKAFGLKVDEFGFGFPPRIFAKKKGDTEYSLNWLPFGGFVRISGERGEFAAIKKDNKEKDNADRTPTEYQQLIEKDAGRLFYTQPAWKKSAIVLAGVVTNFILGWLLISVVLMVGVPQAVLVTGVQPGSPAEKVGFASGDVIKGYKDTQSFIAFVDAHRGQQITIPVLRGGRETDLQVTPRVQTGPNEGPIGVALQQGGAPREAPFAALWHGFQSAGIIGWFTLVAFYDLIRQVFIHASLPAGVVGPVGIFGIAEETGHIGLIYLLQLLGVISINLTVVNLIPFPALDGGRFLVTMIEKIKGSAIPQKMEIAVNGVGFALLLLLMLFLTVRDVRGLF